MVNLSTPTEQLIRELKEDFNKCEYWLKKKYHGERGYLQMRDNLMYKAATTRKQCVSDSIQYLSPNGNRWFVYECARYYKDAQMVKSSMYSVCYYETYGSIGAFLLNHNEDCDVVIIFTSHFFMRFKSRLGVNIDSMTMLKRFCEVIPGYTIQFRKERDEQGFQKVDVRLPGSLGRGIVRDDGLVIEVRSYLTDKQLTKSQQRETVQVRTMGDKQDYTPMDVWQKSIERLPLDDKLDEYQKKVDSMIEMGVPSEIISVMITFTIFATIYVLDKGYIKAGDMTSIEDMSKRLSLRMMDKVADYHYDKITDRELTQTLGEFLVMSFNADINDVYKELDSYLKRITDDRQRNTA